MAEELRSQMRAELEEIDSQIRELMVRVTVGIGIATTALLAGDIERVVVLEESSQIADEIMEIVERQLQVCLARQAPVASDLRFVITALRIVPQLERSVDLVMHIAELAALGTTLPPESLQAFESAGQTVSQMWEATSTAWETRDSSAVQRIDEMDNEVDSVIKRLRSVLEASDLRTQAAMACALLGRFYERLGDHAVRLAQRTAWLATGQ